MSYMGRGDFPSLGDLNNGDIGVNGDNRNHRRFLGYYYFRRYYYIPLDNTYVLMQMIVTFIILIVGVITFISTYKSSIVDPIESTKKIFLNTYLIIIGLFLALTFIINFISKEASVLIKRLVAFLAISIITMLVFGGIKIKLDSTYTREKFEQIYVEQSSGNNSSKNDNSKSRIDIGLGGMSIKTEKQYYVDECMKLYGIFTTKTYGTLALHLLLNILLIFRIVRVSKIGNDKEQMGRDDAVLFDEEENIKI